MADKNVQLGVELLISNRGLRGAMHDLEKGLSRTTKGWMRETKRDVAETIAAATKVALADAGTTKAWNKLVASPIIHLHQQIKKAHLEGNAKLAYQLQNQLKEQKVAYEKELRAREAASEEILRRRRRDTEEQIDDLKSELEGIGSSLFDGRSIADQLISQIRSKGGLLGNLGKHKLAQANELAAKGGPAAAADAQKMAQMGKTLAQIGKTLTVVGAIGGSVLMLIKLFIDLESKIKDMNKSLMSSAGAADFGLSAVDMQMGHLEDRLQQIREDTTAINDNFLKYRVGAEEQQQTLAAFNQAGLTYAKINEQIKEGRDLMKSYSDVTAIAAVYSRNLGTSTDDIAQSMGNLSFETGDHLQTIAEQFSLINRESMAAGFSTKRFYSTVLEVTSGMAFYGVRVEETARMLKNFDSLLGEAVGSDLYKTIVGRGKDMSAQDRIREIILHNPEFVAEQYAKALNRSIADLTKKFGGAGGPLAGLDIGELLKLDEISLQRELQKAQLSPEQITQFLNARLLQRASTGDLAAMTQARGFAGPAFDIAMGAQATGVFGNKRIDQVFRDIESGKMGAEGFAALEQATGKSQDELVKLSRLFTAAEAQLANLDEIRDKIARGEMLTEEDLRVQEKARDKLGLFIDQQTGQILRGQFDANKNLIKGTSVAITDAMDVVTEQAISAGEKEIAEQLTKDQEIASEISKNITGLTEVMQQSVAAILNDIYDVLIDFYRNWLGDTGIESQKLESIEQAHRTRIEYEKRVGALEQERKLLQKQQEDARKRGDTVEAERLKKKQDELIAEMGKLQEVQIKLTKVEEDIKNMEATGKGAEVGLTSARDLGLIDTVSTRAVQQTIDQIAGEDRLLFKSAEKGDLEEAFREGFESLDEETRKGFLDLFGGQKGFDRAIEEAVAAHGRAAERASSARKIFNPLSVRREEAGAAKAAFEQSLLRSAVEAQMGRSLSDAERMQVLMEGSSLPGTAMMLDYLQSIEENTSQGLDNPFGGIVKAQDLILPAGGGRPILTDPADTLMAFKPGGPISKSMGGGNTIKLSFNLFGSPKENTAEILRVLKSLGLAE